MFNKTKPTPPQQNTVPIPDDLPDLTRPGTASAPQAAAPAPRPAPQKTASLLSSDLTFEGNISGAGDLHIDGAVRGDIRVGRLTVGETGNVEGSVLADYVEIRGRVVGAVGGKQVKLMGTAYVDGDITHEQLSIDVGAYFQGRCLQGRKQETPAAPVGFQQPAPMPASAPAPAPQATAASAADSAQLISLKPGA
ncbi:MAG: polymer-forming cytoskeletal protein [Caulobacteraceae bacterium]|nr:polymer-forming cytoskeletal protein [Caulobacteraceae bacterium]